MANERRKDSIGVSVPAAAAAGGGARGEIEALRQKYNELNTRKTRAETNLENARNQLERLKKEARELYGTDDLEALKAQLAQIKADNEAKTAVYRAALAKIESDLSAVEEKYKAASEESA